MTISKGSIPLDHTNLECDLCGSKNIVDTGQEYVCVDCGAVLTLQKLQYDRPYNIDMLQHSVQCGSTQVGTKRERNMHPHSSQLKRMSRVNSLLSNKENAEIRATKEISRIFDCLSLPKTCEQAVKGKFTKVFPQLYPGSAYKNPEKLAAILAYMVLKLENIVINKNDIISTSMLSKGEFNNFIFQIQRFLPEYKKRNRQNYVTQKILEITEHFGCDMSFYYLSHGIMLKLWDNINNNTDDVIAGLCTSILTLCNYKDVISVSSICKLLNIKMSTVQFQVKKRIFERFKLPGFVSLVKSSKLLKGFMKKVGILASEQMNVEIIQEEPSDSGENFVSIQLGNGHPIFNPHNDHYLIESVGDNETITLCYLEVHNPKGKKATRKARNNKGVWFELTSGEYFQKKGPPFHMS